MKRIIYSIALQLFTVIGIAAQDAPQNLSLTLQQAMETAMTNRYDLKNQILQNRIAENEVSKYNAKNLPQVTATFDMRYNSQLQTNILPASAFGGPANTGGSDYKAVQFGTPYFNQFGLALKQNIFDPAQNYDKRVAKANTQVTQFDLKKAEIDVKLSVAQAYYSVLLNQEKVKLNQNTVKRAEEYLMQNQQLFDNKRLMQSDLERYKLDVQNAKLGLDKSEKQYEVSKQYLAYQIGLTENTNITLTDNLSSVTNATSTEGADMNKRVEIQQEKQRLEVNSLNYKKQGFSYLPSVQLYANYNAQQFETQFRPWQGSTWFPYNYVGLLMTLPIFDGTTKTKNRTEFNLKQEINKNTISKLQQDIDYELKSTSVDLENAASSLDYAKANTKQAEDLLNVFKTRNREGTATAAEVTNAENSLLTAQNNLMSAYYDYLVAKLKYQKARGEL